MRSTATLFGPLLAIASAVMLGCNRDANEPAQTGTHADVEAAGQLTEKGRELILTAANDSLLEVEVGKLAEGKAQSDPVKQFARMMVEYYTRTNEELATLARGVNVKIPEALDEDGQQKLDELRNEPGREFDEEYLDLMIDEHERVIRLFEQEAERDGDPPVRAWATQTLPTLRSHLQRAKTIEDAIDEAPLATDVTSPPSGVEDTKSGDSKSGDSKSGDTKTLPAEASPTPSGR